MNSKKTFMFFKLFKSFVIVSTYLSSLLSLLASTDTFKEKDITYKTITGNCPSKSSADLSLHFMKEFEKDHSLLDVKKKIVNEKWEEKYFLNSYNVSYEPLLKQMTIKIDCPEPLAKVQVYKKTGEELYSAILANNSKLYEPQYEMLMRTEKKLDHNLPLIALRMDQIESNFTQEIARLMSHIDSEFRRYISEILLGPKMNLTVILGLKGTTTSVFFGKDLWEEKTIKLTKILSFMGEKKKFPTSINLINPKKVVVKFSDKN